MKQLTDWLKQSHMRQVTLSANKKLTEFEATIIETSSSGAGQVVCSDKGKDPYMALLAVCVKFSALGPQVWNKKV